MNISALEIKRMYEEFNKYLNSLGIPAIKSDYYFTNYISITIKNIPDIQKTKSLALHHSTEIIDVFKSLLRSYGYKADYDKYEWSQYSVSLIYSEQAHEIDKLIRESKSEIIAHVKKQIPSKYRPKYTFIHSSNYEVGGGPGGYFFIFSSIELLENSKGSIQDTICNICHNVLQANDSKRVYAKQYVDVSFFHVKDPVTNGMYRED